MKLTVVALAFVFGLPLVVLPALGRNIYLSPDETAVAASADRFTKTGSFRFPIPFGTIAPDLHPRSFVTNGDAMVPVGFLGMPLLIAGLIWIVGPTAAQLFTPLLVFSAIVPLLAFTKKWGKWSQAATVVTWLSFPTVILYANRGFFPNLVVVCLAVWASWLVTRGKWKWDVAAGLLTGIALAIRPTEAIWLLPWIVFSYATLRPSTMRMRRALTVVAFGVPLLLVAIGASLVAWKTYGHPFAVGYELRDPISTVLSSETAGAGTAAPLTWLPFGFHPRNVWWNVRSFLLGYLAPLSVMVLAAVAVAIRRRERWWLAIGAWTVVALCLLYGQGLYQDHVRPNAVTLGNSFLRYTVPFSILAAFAAGYLVNEIRSRWSKYSSFVIPAFLVLIVAFGWWTALMRDDEGLMSNRIEIERYARIRESALQLLSNTNTIILSDRSDKIFFPVYAAASPLPSMDRIFALNQAVTGNVAVFIRTVDDDALALWKSKGMELFPLVDAGNETLYVVQ